jgi:hypothetical protein
MKQATIVYASGWYVVPLEPNGLTPAHFSRRGAVQYAEREGYEIVHADPDQERPIRFAKTPAEERPHPVPYVRVPFAWLAYWALTALDVAVGKLRSIIWRARRHVGVVMFDRPCPRCGKSFSGCDCRLVTPNWAEMEIPPEAEIYARGVTMRLRYQPRTRSDLFNWARHHEFFADGAIDGLRYDDRVWRAMRSGERAWRAP